MMHFRRLIAITGFFVLAMTARATTYYSTGSTDVTLLTSWNTLRTGLGSAPATFTTGDIFIIQGIGNGGTTPHSMTTSATWTVSGATGKLEIENGATLTATFILAVPNFQVDNGAYYIHNAASSALQGLSSDIPGSLTRVFGASSTVEIQKWANGGNGANPLPTLVNPGWGNLTINVATLGGSWNQQGTLTMIQGNFMVLATGGFDFRFTGAATYTGIIGGDVTITGGITTLTSAGGNPTETINGNFTITSGTFNGTNSSSSWTLSIIKDLNISGTGVFNFVGSSSSNKTYLLNLGGNFNMVGGFFGLISSGFGSPNLGCSVVFTGGSTVSTFNQASGSFTLINGGRGISWIVNSGKTLTLNTNFAFPVTVTNPLISLTVNSGGVLNTSTNLVTGTASFILANGGGLQIGSTNGISVFPTASGSIQNTGGTAVRTFNKGADYTYNGSTAQVSGNGIPDSVKSLTINNSTGLTLSNPSLTDTLTLGLTSGRIKTDAAHSLILAKTTSISSTVNIYGDLNEGIATSFVTGPLKVERSDTLLFTVPIGKDTSTGVYFSPVKLKPTNLSTKTYTVEYFPVAHANTANYDAAKLNHVSKVEYWDISCDVITSPQNNAKVGLSWRPMSKVSDGVAVDSAQAMHDLVVAHYFNDGSGTKWTLENNGPTFTIRTGSNLSYGYVTTDFASASFSPFTLASKSTFNLLPLKLITFTGSPVQKGVILQWTTKEEINVAGFDIERSTDGIAFRKLGSVNAYGELINNYKFFDASPATGWNYYRLKVIDNLGVQKYTNAISIHVENRTPFYVLVNPVQSKLVLMHEKANQNASVSIYSADGILVGKYPISEGSYSTEINASTLQHGVFIAAFSNTTAVQTIKFLKQ